MAGRRDHVERETGELERVAAGDAVLRRVRLERPEAGPAHVVVDVLEDLDLARRAVDGRARVLRHRGDGADVVEVAVRDQDRLDPDVALGDLALQALGLLAGIDQDRAAVLRDEPGVLLHRPDGEADDLHQPFSRWRSMRLYTHLSVM